MLLVSIFAAATSYTLRCWYLPKKYAASVLAETAVYLGSSCSLSLHGTAAAIYPWAAAINPCCIGHLFKYLKQLLSTLRHLISISPAAAAIYPCCGSYLPRSYYNFYLQQLLSIPQLATNYPCSCYLSILAAPPPPKRKLDGRLEELATLTRMVNMEERASYIYNSDCLLRP
jgi:hypothetical protein